MLILGGCIKNDIPYPRIQPNFSKFEVVDQERPAAIDTIGRTITVYLAEEADIMNVQVSDFALTPSGAVWPDSLSFINGFDLSTPVNITVALYQEYQWRVSAVQEIERYFTFDSQIGVSTIDVESHRVVAYINQKADLRKVKVNTIKLGGITSVMTPDLTGETVDFTGPVEVTVSEFGRDTRWTIFITPTEATVTTERVDAWTCVAWVYGSAEAGQDNGVEYRRADSSEWIRLDASDVTHDGGNFTGRIIHLSPMTTYVARAYSGNDMGDPIEFTTGTTFTIPNGSMDDWWLNGKIWCPWAEGGTSWWDTGNRGATTLGPSNTTPTDDTSSGTGRAARLESKFVGIGAIGKLAAGNLFAGSYVKTDGTNGILSFGRPVSVFPTKLKGFMKYHSAPISSVSSGFADLKNRPDTATIWIALIDSPEPFEIRTNPSNRHLFDPDGEEVVAYGVAQWGYDVEEYRRFEVTLNYKSTARTPRYMLIVASASKYGDYFTGGNGSVLYVDDFSLDFDY